MKKKYLPRKQTRKTNEKINKVNTENKLSVVVPVVKT